MYILDFHDLKVSQLRGVRKGDVAIFFFKMHLALCFLHLTLNPIEKKLIKYIIKPTKAIKTIQDRL